MEFDSGKILTNNLCLGVTLILKKFKCVKFGNLCSIIIKFIDQKQNFSYVI